MKITCPTCGVLFKMQDSEKMHFITNTKYVNYDSYHTGYEVRGTLCPDCDGIIIRLSYGELLGNSANLSLDPTEIAYEMNIYPNPKKIELPNVIPEKYRKDFSESSQIISISPKASAAMSRTMLQTILREEFGIKKKDLYTEIEEFVTLPNVPSYLTDSVDAIRIIGNLAAHPHKSIQTGEIMEVEDGEAEWLLEVLEALFDFTFIQPLKLQDRKEKLNAKLRELGKAEMQTK